MYALVTTNRQRTEGNIELPEYTKKPVKRSYLKDKMLSCTGTIDRA